MEEKHFTVSAFIVFDNKVLLHMHKKIGLILQPGGHIEKNESPQEAILREVKEETGLDIELYKSQNYRNLNSTLELNSGLYLNLHSVGDHFHMDFIFYARAIKANIKPNIDETGKDWTWYSKEEIELNSKIPENVKVYALEALKIFKE